MRRNCPNNPKPLDFVSDPGDEDATRQFGGRWSNAGRSLAVLVPSVIIPIEFNVLLNPTHAGFDAIEWKAPEPFGFDRRLLKVSKTEA